MVLPHSSICVRVRALRVHVEDRERVPVGHEAGHVVHIVVLGVTPLGRVVVAIGVVQVLAARARRDVHDAVRFGHGLPSNLRSTVNVPGTSRFLLLTVLAAPGHVGGRELEWARSLIGMLVPMQQ